MFVHTVCGSCSHNMQSHSDCRHLHLSHTTLVNVTEILVWLAVWKVVGNVAAAAFVEIHNLWSPAGHAQAMC